MTDNECKKLLKNKLISYRNTLKLPKEVTFGVEIEYENIVKDTVSCLFDDETYFEVKEIDALGKEFDPSLEQAVVMDKDEDKESGVVLEVFQKGYTYKDRVLRTAMVKVNE